MAYNDYEDDEDEDKVEDDPFAPLVKEDDDQDDSYLPLDPAELATNPAINPASPTIGQQVPEQRGVPKSVVDYSKPINSVSDSASLDSVMAPAPKRGGSFEDDAVQPRPQVEVKRTTVTTPNASAPSGRSAREKLYRDAASSETNAVDASRPVLEREAQIVQDDASRQETALLNKRLKFDNIQRKQQSDLANYQAQIDRRVAELDALSKEKDATVDRERFWKNKGVVEKVLLGVLYGVGAGQLVQNAIDNDIRQQRENIDAKKTNRDRRSGALKSLLEINKEKYSTEKEATAMTELQIIDGYRDELQSSLLKATSERAANNLQSEINKLDKRREDVMLNLRGGLLQESEKAASAEAAEARRRAETEALAGAGIVKIGDKYYQSGGTDDNGRPILRNLGDGPGNGKVSEGSMKLDSTIAGTDKVISDLNKIDPNTVLPEQGNIVTRNVQKAKEYVAGRQARGLTPQQQILTNAQQAAMGMITDLRNSGVINEGERPDIERAILSGTAKDLAFALSAMNEVARVKRKARGD